ncbi:citrate synthase/methylcitrate synthase [Alkalihalobacterium chitinilyticum]|uniref:Citrate synthase n=1 Tax=Alkalihalobacterium chitinilyticum TaxID=2980103 RepID=A0ABT5V8V5_9BACI|nr:citrate synthase/methylcitrate synthase [Alkalihalobacterium chitinilyticum]MDE5411767.1 citrate synthase/methylcitrate synthase [Alkalihalobacterium chitinilyticum]
MVNKGLKGVVAAETAISHIDGKEGKLIYRGYEIRNLTAAHSFEEVAFLLWFGHLPTVAELDKLNTELVKSRYLTETMKTVMDVLPTNMDFMSVIRTVISAEGTIDYGWKPTISQAITLTAVMPTIIAYWYNKVQGKTCNEPVETLSHVENYLYMLNGSSPLEAQVEALETYMILTLEHGMNASTFSARVTASTESDIVSAITSAIGTMKGPLHGGAPSGVIDLLNAIETVEKTEDVIRKKLMSGEKLMGFGHRVYKTHDPRAIALRKKLIGLSGEDRWLDLAVHVENVAVKLLNELKPGRALYTNVEFYAAAIMKSINLAPELFTPTFTASRVVGWSAHVLEQAEDNTIFRPQSEYVGTMAQM